MPVLGAGEAEDSITVAFDWFRLDVKDFDGVVAVGPRAPTHQTIALEEKQRNGIKETHTHTCTRTFKKYPTTFE